MKPTRSVIALSKGLRTAFREPKVQGLLGLTFTLIFAATMVYHFVEGWSYLDAAYFSVMTISTVGYGDITPVTTIGKLFTIFYVLCGLGVFVAAATAIAESLLKGRKAQATPSPDP